MILNVGNTTNTTNHQHIQNDTMNTSNSNNTMKTIHINDECTQNTQSNGQLAPLLDAYEPFSGSGNNSHPSSTILSGGDLLGIPTNNLSSDDDDASDNDTVTTSKYTETCTSTELSLNNIDFHGGGYNEMELEKSINEFFNVIDSAGMGSVNFEILKICLKLLGIDLSAYQLDILLNELTSYKPSLPISKEMMYQFLLLYDVNHLNGNKTKRKHTDNLQVTIIRTEIIVGLLANQQTTFANQNKYNLSETNTKKNGKVKIKKK